MTRGSLDERWCQCCGHSGFYQRPASEAVYCLVFGLSAVFH